MYCRYIKLDIGDFKISSSAVTHDKHQKDRIDKADKKTDLNRLQSKVAGRMIVRRLQVFKFTGFSMKISSKTVKKEKTMVKRTKLRWKIYDCHKNSKNITHAFM